MSLPSSPLGFSLSRKPLGFPGKSSSWTMHQKPLGQFTPGLDRFPLQPQAMTPCLGQIIQTKLLTHPLIAASGIEPPTELQTQPLQRTKRQFPRLQFISFDPETLSPDSIFSPDTGSLVEPSEPSEPPESTITDAPATELSRQTDDIVSPQTEPIQTQIPQQPTAQSQELESANEFSDSLTNDLSTDLSNEPNSIEQPNPDSTTPLQPSAPLPSHQKSAADTRQAPPQGSSDALSLKPSATLPNGQPDELPLDPAKPTADQPLDSSLPSRPEPPEFSRGQPVPSVAVADSPATILPSLLTQQPETTPKVPTPLPLPNQLQPKGQPQPLETLTFGGALEQLSKSSQQPESQLPAPPLQLSPAQSTAFAVTQPSEIEPAESRLESLLKPLATDDDSSQNLTLLPNLQRTPTQPLREIPLEESLPDISPETFPDISPTDETIDEPQSRPSLWEQASFTESETTYTATPFPGASKIVPDMPFAMDGPQVQPQKDSALIAPSTNLQADVSLTSPITSPNLAPPDLELPDTKPFQPFLPPAPAAEITNTATYGGDSQVNRATDVLQQKSALQPQTSPDETLENASDIAPPSIQTQKTTPIQPPVEDASESQWSDLPHAPVSPPAPTSDRLSPPKPPLQAKFMPLMPPLQRPLGPWDIVQDMMKRAITAQQSLNKTATTDPQSEEIGQPGVIQPRLHPSTQADSSTPETWSSLDDLLATSHPPPQREAWEDQFSLLTPATAPRSEEIATTNLAQTTTDYTNGMTAQLPSAAIESDLQLPRVDPQTPTPSIKLVNPLAEDSLSKRQQTIQGELDDDILEQLAQSLFKQVRDRLVVTQERMGTLGHYPAPWLTTTTQSGMPDSQTLSASTQDISHKSEWPIPLSVDALIQTVLFNLTQRLNNDRERHGF